MKITIGITTYGRADLLEKSAISLLFCEGILDCNIRVYDDCSPFWDIDYLRKVFPSAAEIIRRKRNLGADGNMHRMFLDFLTTEDDLLFIADSDLIFRPDVITCIADIMPLTDGIISVYNSAMHRAGESFAAAGIALNVKNQIGAAGTVMTRSIVQDITDNVPPSRSYDWDWCRYLEKNKKKIYVTKESYVQHIGVHGQNSSSFSTEYGLHFYPRTEVNEKILVDFFQQVISQKDSIIRSYRLFKPLVFPQRTVRNFRAKIRLFIAKVFNRLIFNH